MNTYSRYQRPIMDLANGRWEHILTLLGVEPMFLRNIHGPCPFCGGKDRFRFDNKGGEGTFFCNQCSPGNGMEFAKRWLNLEFGPAADRVRAILGEDGFAHQASLAKPCQAPTPSTSPSRDRAQWLWGKGTQITSDDDAGVYLLSRALHIPETAEHLRFMPQCMHSTGNSYPALLAAIRCPKGQLVSVHKTFLLSGKKAPVQSVREVLKGRLLTGAAIQLGSSDRIIGVGEGIESSLAASTIWDVPTFATLSANGMVNFVPPAGVEVVVIYADNDGSGCGQRAARELAERLKADGYEVYIEIPEHPDTDWNDVLIAHPGSVDDR